MKLSIKTKIQILFTLLLIICFSFNLYVHLKFRNLDMTISVIVFSIILISLYFVFIMTIRKYGQDLLSKLSDMILALIDMREEAVFSDLEDSMLSKLQSQVIKLTGILNMQNKRLKRNNDEIKSLISDISHQLKTPVANLKIYCELLQDKSLSYSQREDFTKNIESQLNKLSFLMESMIKMSRLESGIIKVNPKLESLNKTCLAAIKQVYQKAIKKDIEINFLENGEVFTKHDTNWTTEAVFNILDNAVKYIPSGGNVTLRLEKYEMYARIDIIDNGKGILESDINNIFKRFYRGRDTSNEEGVGLGLYLTREIITKQEGYIRVNSEKDKGSNFSLFLPLN